MGATTILRKYLPKPVKVLGRKSIKLVKYNYRRVNIMLPVMRNQKIKIIAGAAETYQDGWYSTNECWLDIARADHWRNVFQGKKLLTHVVAEHVFEHLRHEEAQAALNHIAAHMLPGGRVRIAVPDGYNPNPEYLRHVGINGIGDDASDHKQLLNVDILTALLENVGFRATQVEGYDRAGRLIQTPWSTDDGYIRRSRTHSTPQKAATWLFPDADTSLIVDGIKV